MTPIIQHYLQRDIIRQLSRSSRLSFSELQPAGIDNGIFSYHLKQLVGTGLVTKQQESYMLTAAGLQYASLATRTNIDILPSPKIICLLLIEDDAGQFVLYKRNAAPFLGQYTFPGGNLFYGESLDELVKRQLIEKIGFIMSLEHRGIIDLLHATDNLTIAHVYAHLFYGRYNHDEHPQPKAKDPRFTPEWIKPQNQPPSSLMPDVLEILQTVKHNDGFFFYSIKQQHEDF